MKSLQSPLALHTISNITTNAPNHLHTVKRHSLRLNQDNRLWAWAFLPKYVDPI